MVLRPRNRSDRPHARAARSRSACAFWLADGGRAPQAGTAQAPIFPDFQRLLKAVAAITGQDAATLFGGRMAIDGRTAEKLRGFLRELTPRARAMLLAGLERSGERGGEWRGRR